MRSLISTLAIVTALASAAPAWAQQHDDHLLFHASLDTDATAEVAGGAAVPNFRSDVAIVPDGAIRGAARWGDGGYVAWEAPGNMLAARGTLSFFWRPRTPVGEAPFVIFRAGFADHSSWDMAFLRIDWNGHGFDAFVTDANLSRVRVSWRIDTLPPATSYRRLTSDSTVDFPAPLGPTSAMVCPGSATKDTHVLKSALVHVRLHAAARCVREQGNRPACDRAGRRRSSSPSWGSSPSGVQFLCSSGKRLEPGSVTEDHGASEFDHET